MTQGRLCGTKQSFAEGASGRSSSGRAKEGSRLADDNALWQPQRKADIRHDMGHLLTLGIV